ncbi:hypothetical protein TNIN_430321 [Trichonephila inaurata madagascariensis]|uniref:Uncharacterized protein n=1 Tax=Trichonephila inaurata madagascariensis TaxID=2747483 RepID=A0A8X6JWT1_9ARAC|nr:hypothetical protein TNIN_430321 [Trichonephila inaurata madagascariensis]
MRSGPSGSTVRDVKKWQPFHSRSGCTGPQIRSGVEGLPLDKGELVVVRKRREATVVLLTDEMTVRPTVRDVQ